MRKVELLAPAGSLEALTAAVQNGCDAVYLGGTMFGARAYADNFSQPELAEALAYAHGYGVKVYVTMNTLIHEAEMDAAVKYAQWLYEQGVDALIIQDLGLFDVVHQRFPTLALHASTQMHIHNEAGVCFMRDAGMKRIVLPREATIEAVRQLSQLGIETEVFVQGALCISYSGQCLMSAKKLSRSGNRGACAQMCRMKYRLGCQTGDHIDYVSKGGDYLLSPKDLNTLAHIPALIEAGVTSFKIEGRMKRAAYVAQMTAAYRQAIDAYYHHQAYVADAAAMEMKKVFNRGFTAGHLFHQQGDALMNPYRPNHMGIKIGRVLAQKDNRVRVKLSAALYQFDGIRFLSESGDCGCVVNKLYDEHHRLVNHVEADQVAEIAVNARIPKGSVVVKTSDNRQLEALQQSYRSGKRRVPVYLHFTLRLDQIPVLKVWDDEGNTCEVCGSQPAQRATRGGIEEKRIRQQLQKCGNTIFTAVHTEIDHDQNALIAIQAINDLRRRALTALYQLRTQPPQSLSYGTYHRELHCEPLSGCYVRVQTKEQAQSALKLGITHLYCESGAFRSLQDEDHQIGYVGKRVMNEDYPQAPFLFSEIGALMRHNGIAEHFMNITNAYAAAFLFAHGVKGIILSNECSDEQIQAIHTAFHERYGCAGSFLSYVYGKEELMVMKHCPIRTALAKDQPQPCGLCHGESTYFISDIHDHRYPLYGDEDCHIHLLNDQADVRTPLTDAIFLCFYDESKEEVTAMIQKMIGRSEASGRD